MTDNPTRKMTTIRLPPDLLDWAGKYAAERGISKTHLIEELLTALREGRFVSRPRAGPNAFPAQEVYPGASPEFPVLIAPGRKT